jgi:phosphoadenosine phosphosulfate reductase
MNHRLEQISLAAENWDTGQLLRWAFATYRRHIAIASALGAEGVVLIDIASRIDPNVSVFMLDTQLLFPETYELAARIERRYNLKIERIYPARTPEEQAGYCGPALWNRNPDQCCSLRKVEPLERKLRQLKSWITSIRRDQTPARASTRKVEWDDRFGLAKINPLADWTSEMVWSHIRKNNLPYNPLHDRNYPSIGCTHCTRPVSSNEDPRAGRWPGLPKTECGLHQRILPVPASSPTNLTSLSPAPLDPADSAAHSGRPARTIATK